MLQKGILLFLFLCFSLHPFIVAQETPPFGKPVPVQFSRNKEPYIDMFMNNWRESKPRFVYGTLEVWDILTKCKGNPLRPAKKGAVLTDINALSYAILGPRAATKPSTLTAIQQIFYIVSGEGTVKSGGKSAKLREGIGIIMPPGIEFTLTNPGKEQLAMYIVEEPVPRDFKPNKAMVVKDEYDNIISTNVNRTDSDNWLFSINDGLSTIVAFNPIMYEPMSLVPPHVHPQGVEEVWIAVKGELQMQVGSQRRKFTPGTAYKPPADGVTPHTNINNTDVSKKLLWMMKVPVVETPTRREPDEKNPKELKGVI